MSNKNETLDIFADTLEELVRELIELRLKSDEDKYMELLEKVRDKDERKFD